VKIGLEISNLSTAMMAAEKLLTVAKKDAEAIAAEKDAAERAGLLSAYGVSESDKLPPNLRSSFKELEDNQKRRQTRLLRDGIDRILTDLESIFRDILSLQLATNSDLYNPEHSQELESRAALGSAQMTIDVLDAISKARVRLAANVRDLVVLEALCTKLIFRRQNAA
jgi:DNA polymerase-3 subunit delta'